MQVQIGTTPHLLIIEDNRDIAGLAAMHLRDGGYEVSMVHDGDEGLRTLQANHYQLIILDLMLPGVDGLEICRRLREQHNPTPILMLTARSTEQDRVLGLEIGADDYLTKPFGIRELLARVKAILRRGQANYEVAMTAENNKLCVQDLEIDRQRRTVTQRGNSIDLTVREFELLYHFAMHPGRVYSRLQLLDSVWGYGHDGYEHTVNSHINRLRAKIESDPAHPHYILTVWGVGYKFAEVDAEL